MATTAARRVTVGQDKNAHKVYNRNPRWNSNNNVCAYWLAGRCNRNPCRFMHVESRPLTYTRNSSQSCSSSLEDYKVNKSTKLTPKASQVSVAKDNGCEACITQQDTTKVTSKINEKICEYWLSGNCVHGDKCKYLHSWFRGEGFTRFTQLEGHKKAITGIALPSGSDKLYSGSNDGTVRVWDCNSGQCGNVINLEDKVGSLISEGPWVFVGMPNTVKAWNISTFAEHILTTGPVGQVYAMIVGKETLFAGSQDGTILAWKACSESNPFHLAASLKGHKSSVISLAVGRDRLYSGSMDCTIKVWDIYTLQCIHTLNGHTQAVTSLLCWDEYLLSSSLDGTIKAWGTTESGDNLEVTHTHKIDIGVLALCGIHDTEAKPILICSCNDNSVHLYELPSFNDRGRLYAKQEVRAIQTGPGGIFFTGDGIGQLAVWKWLTKQNAEAS